MLGKEKILTLNTAHKLARKYDLIAVEDLNIKGLARNTKLSKSIYDAAWGAFIERLNAVAVKRGVHVSKDEWPFATTSESYIASIAVIVVKKYLKLCQLELTVVLNVK